MYVYFKAFKLFKQRKQLILTLNFHADTAATFRQMYKTLNLQYHGIFGVSSNLVNYRERKASQTPGSSNFV